MSAPQVSASSIPSTPTTASTASTAPDASYVAVCALAAIEVEGGVAALVGGEVVALFRTHDDGVFALGNYDPYSRASVLARGIVGTRTTAEGEVPFVASPMHKQAFDLRTGQCLDDAAVRVPTYAVHVADGLVHVGPAGPAPSAVDQEGP